MGRGCRSGIVPDGVVQYIEKAQPGSAGSRRRRQILHPAAVTLGERRAARHGQPPPITTTTPRRYPDDRLGRGAGNRAARAQAAADKLATDVSIVDVSDRLAITDAFVLASAPNERQVQSIVDAVEERLRAHGIKPVRREGVAESRWVLLDFIDVVVHVQHAEERAYYALERLWRGLPDHPLHRPARTSGRAGTAPVGRRWIRCRPARPRTGERCLRRGDDRPVRAAPPRAAGTATGALAARPDRVERRGASRGTSTLRWTRRRRQAAVAAAAPPRRGLAARRRRW